MAGFAYLKLVQGSYAHRIPACRMRRLKGCPDGNASTAWDYADLLCNHYRDADSKCCRYSYTSRAQSPLKHFLHIVQHVADWVVLFSRSQHFPSSSLKFIHTNPSPHPLLSFLTCTRVGGNYHYHECLFFSV